jgi:hypothetical protein
MPYWRLKAVLDLQPASASSANCWRTAMRDFVFHGMTAKNHPSYPENKTVSHVLSP